MPEESKKIENPLQLINLINEKATSIIESLGGPDKYLEILDEISIDKVNFKIYFYHLLHRIVCDCNC